MKYTIALLFFSFIVNGTVAQSSTNPCMDSIFMALKKKPIEQLTDGEYAYFQQKELDCNNFQLQAKQDREKLKAQDNPKPVKGNTVVWVVGVAVAISAALFIFNFSK